MNQLPEKGQETHAGPGRTNHFPGPDRKTQGVCGRLHDLDTSEGLLPQAVSNQADHQQSAKDRGDITKPLKCWSHLGVKQVNPYVLGCALYRRTSQKDATGQQCPRELDLEGQEEAHGISHDDIHGTDEHHQKNGARTHGERRPLDPSRQSVHARDTLDVS